MFDPNVAFTASEINLIELAGLAIEPFRAFYTLFPDQNIDTAIGGYLMELKKTASVTEEAVPAAEETVAPSTGEVTADVVTE